MLSSFYLKLNVLKNSPGYRPRQVCDFAQGDIRSRVPGGSWSWEKSGSRTSLLWERIRKRERAKETKIEKKERKKDTKTIAQLSTQL